MFDKYNIDEIRAGGRNLGIALVASGVLGMLLDHKTVGALVAIACGTVLFLKASEVRSKS